MFLTDHMGTTYHYSEQKGSMIVSVTAFFFDTGALYHIAYSSGDVDVIERTAATGRYLGFEKFNLPDIRFTTTEIDFSGVIMGDDNFTGSVRVGTQDIPVPRHQQAFPTVNDGWLTWFDMPREGYTHIARRDIANHATNNSSTVRYGIDPETFDVRVMVDPDGEVHEEHQEETPAWE